MKNAFLMKLQTFENFATKIDITNQHVLDFRSNRLQMFLKILQNLTEKSLC